MRIIIASIKLLAFCLWSALCVPLQIITLLVTKKEYAYLIPWIWHVGICRIFFIKVTHSGNFTNTPSTLYISNHMSWLDIPVIGSTVRASFVAKREVATWPIFGFLSKLQQTAFIDRSRNAALKEKNSLKNQLENGKRLILFPEGTSSNGQEVLPFKSSLLEVAKTKCPLSIQPFSLTIKTISNKNVVRDEQYDIYAWYGDMTLAPHLWSFAKAKGAHIHLDFLESITIEGEIDRKELTKIIRDKVALSFNTHQTKQV